MLDSRTWTELELVAGWHDDKELLLENAVARLDKLDTAVRAFTAKVKKAGKAASEDGEIMVQFSKEGERLFRAASAFGLRLGNLIDPSSNDHRIAERVLLIALDMTDPKKGPLRFEQNFNLRLRAVALNNLATVLAQAKRLVEAVERVQGARELEAELGLAAESPATTMFNESQIYLLSGRTADAMASFANTIQVLHTHMGRALTVREKATTGSLLLAAMRQLSGICEVTRRYDDAVSTLQDALVVAREVERAKLAAAHVALTGAAAAATAASGKPQKASDVVIREHNGRKMTAVREAISADLKRCQGVIEALRQRPRGFQVEVRELPKPRTFEEEAMAAKMAAAPTRKGGIAHKGRDWKLSPAVLSGNVGSVAQAEPLKLTTRSTSPELLRKKEAALAALNANQLPPSARPQSARVGGAGAKGGKGTTHDYHDAVSLAGTSVIAEGYGVRSEVPVPVSGMDEVVRQLPPTLRAAFEELQQRGIESKVLVDDDVRRRSVVGGGGTRSSRTALSTQFGLDDMDGGGFVGARSMNPGPASAPTTAPSAEQSGDLPQPPQQQQHVKQSAGTALDSLTLTLPAISAAMPLGGPLASSTALVVRPPRTFVGGLASLQQTATATSSVKSSHLVSPATAYSTATSTSRPASASSSGLMPHPPLSIAVTAQSGAAPKSQQPQPPQQRQDHQRLPTPSPLPTQRGGDDDEDEQDHHRHLSPATAARHSDATHPVTTRPEHSKGASPLELHGSPAVASVSSDIEAVVVASSAAAGSGGSHSPEPRPQQHQQQQEQQPQLVVTPPGSPLLQPSLLPATQPEQQPQPQQQQQHIPRPPVRSGADSPTNALTAGGGSSTSLAATSGRPNNNNKLATLGGSFASASSLRSGGGGGATLRSSGNIRDRVGQPAGSSSSPVSPLSLTMVTVTGPPGSPAGSSSSNASPAAGGGRRAGKPRSYKPKSVDDILSMTFSRGPGKTGHLGAGKRGSDTSSAHLGGGDRTTKDDALGEANEHTMDAVALAAAMAQLEASRAPKFTQSEIATIVARALFARVSRVLHVQRQQVLLEQQVLLLVNEQRRGAILLAREEMQNTAMSKAATDFVNVWCRMQTQRTDRNAAMRHAAEVAERQLSTRRQSREHFLSKAHGIMVRLEQSELALAARSTEHAEFLRKDTVTKFLMRSECVRIMQSLLRSVGSVNVCAANQHAQLVQELTVVRRHNLRIAMATRIQNWLRRRLSLDFRRRQARARRAERLEKLNSFQLMFSSFFRTQQSCRIVYRKKVEALVLSMSKFAAIVRARAVRAHLPWIRWDHARFLERKQLQSVLIIQHMFLFWTLMSEFTDPFQGLSQDEVDSGRRHYAALRIQARFRSHLYGKRWARAREQLQAKKAKELTALIACVSVQRWWHCAKARRARRRLAAEESAQRTLYMERELRRWAGNVLLKFLRWASRTRRQAAIALWEAEAAKRQVARALRIQRERCALSIQRAWRAHFAYRCEAAMAFDENPPLELLLDLEQRIEVQRTADVERHMSRVRHQLAANTATQILGRVQNEEFFECAAPRQ